MKIIFLVAILATGVAHSAPKDAQLIARAKESISEDLKDPDSTNFRRIQVIRGSVCGEINAKNSMGGYVGYKRFFSVGGIIGRIDDDSSSFQTSWDASCLKVQPKAKKPAEYYEESWKDMK